MHKMLATKAGKKLANDVGDVPGWVLITLMTAGLQKIGVLGLPHGSDLRAAV
jgi:hypothetical protein